MAEEKSPSPLKTSLARRLWKIREKIIASGQPLLNWAEIEKEIKERHGEPAE